MKLSDITPTWLRDTFLFGIDLIDQNGNPISDDSLTFYINSGIDLAEKLLDIQIRFVDDITEKHDSRYNENLEGWGFVQLYKKPVDEVYKVSLEFGNHAVFEFPIEWVEVQKLRGQIQVIPYLGKSSIPFMTTQGGYMYPRIARLSYIPQIIVVNYSAGYKPDDDIPDLLARLIGMLSTMAVLDVFGDIVLGMPALSGYTISMDGLSQSVQTTNSATSAAYRGRIESYNKQIKDYIIPALRTYYQGVRISSP